MKAAETRSVWVDNLRCIATLAVVIIHFATPVVVTPYNSYGGLNTQWWVGNVYDSFSRFCVPVFVMLTGTLLLPQTISLRVFIKKRFNRLLLPFIFWSLMYIVFNLALKIRDEGSAHALSNWASWLAGQLTGGAAPHLWYVYMIIGIYLFIPIIQPWITGASHKAILMFLGIWLLTIITGQQKALMASSPLDLRYFGGYLGYLVLGYYLSERLVITRYIQLIAFPVFVIGFAGTLFGTSFYTSNIGVFVPDFYDYLTLNVFLQAASAFIIIKSHSSVQNKPTAFSGVRNTVSKYGYGIYLGHLLVLSIMTHFKLDNSFFTPTVGIPFSSIICLIITYALVYVINKMPYGKYISG